MSNKLFSLVSNSNAASFVPGTHANGNQIFFIDNSSNKAVAVQPAAYIAAKGKVYGTTDYRMLANKPTSFTPSAHNHDDRYVLKSNVSASTPTLAWGTTSSIMTVDGKTAKVTMPANPNTSTTTESGHYTPSGTNGTHTTTAGSAVSWSGEVITGLTLDSKKHVVGVTTGTIPANPARTAAANAPLSEKASGVVGTSAKYAREDHRHPLTTVFINGTGTTAGSWLGNSDQITEYFDGLTIFYRIGIAGISSGSKLKINDLAECNVIMNSSTNVTTQYNVGTILTLTYYNGKWYTKDYNSDTYYNHMFYGYPIVGGVGCFNASLCALNTDGGLESFTTTSGTSTSKAPNTSAKFNLNTKIWYYNGSTLTSGNAKWTLWDAYSTCDARYTGNYASSGTTAIGYYKDLYLKITINSDSTWSPAGCSSLRNSVLVPRESLESGSYYIHIGFTYSSSVYKFVLNIDNPVYYYNGSALIPYEQKHNFEDNWGEWTPS